MSTPTFERIDAVLDGDDTTFRAGLPDIVETPSDDATLATLLLDHPTLYERLSSRPGTIDAPEKLVDSTA
ncbi:thioredoxin domain-containing protein [Halocatena halophila]|uniref:hypothetical protein n=1 Tax=Halocatena halophila TaxID=2814576 RepID=UPI002ED6B940